MLHIFFFCWMCMFDPPCSMGPLCGALIWLRVMVILATIALVLWVFSTAGFSELPWICTTVHAMKLCMF